VVRPIPQLLRSNHHSHGEQPLELNEGFIRHVMLELFLTPIPMQLPPSAAASLDRHLGISHRSVGTHQHRWIRGRWFELLF